MEEIRLSPVDMVDILFFTGVLYIPGGAGFLPSTVSLEVVVSRNFRKVGASGRRVASPYNVWSWQSIGFDYFSPEKQQSQT